MRDQAWARRCWRYAIAVLTRIRNEFQNDIKVFMIVAELISIHLRTDSVEHSRVLKRNSTWWNSPLGEPRTNR